MNLAGRVALVTGGARRVGRAIALRLADEGCRLAIHAHRSLDAAEQTAADCRARGAAAETFAADFSDRSATAALPASVVDRFGGLDVLINNASVFETMTLDELDLERWDRTLETNLTAPLILAHAARAALQARRGAVVNLCDAAIDRPWPDHLAYCVSKGGLVTLTKLLARALAPEVNVVGVAPGVAAWPEHYDEALRDRLTRKIPLQRPGAPEDIAAAVVYLLGAGDYVNGAILPVDGGRHIV